MPNYKGHNDSKTGRVETVRMHLEEVASEAARHADVIGWAPEAHLAGILHDAGKYGDLMGDRLRQEVGPLDHSTTGASIVLRHYEKHGVKEDGILVATVIDVHHSGLGSICGKTLQRILDHLPEKPDEYPLAQPDIEEAIRCLEEDGIVLPPPFESVLRSAFASKELRHKIDTMLAVRFLLSCVCDADYTVTEAHYNSDENRKPVWRPRGPRLHPRALSLAIERDVAHLRVTKASSPQVERMRAMVRADALAAAKAPTGQFTLSAITGTGKSYSLLAFALDHAEHNGQDRVFVIEPYLSIIDQTVDSYRKLAGDAHGRDVAHLHVIEDDSMTRGRNSDDKETRENLLAQNWDAPIIVTSTVRFLEAAFSNRPGPLRGLHNAFNSVVVLDEAQMIPPHLAAATVAFLANLPAWCRTSVVLATATQPAFDILNDVIQQQGLSAHRWEPTEIISADTTRFMRNCVRTQVDWSEVGTPQPFEALAERICDDPQHLAVFELKDQSRTVSKLVRRIDPDHSHYISSAMCPLHRRHVMSTIKADMAAGLPCHLVGTSALEAGNDLDFAVGSRQMTNVISANQTGGRVNRNGTLASASLRMFSILDPDTPVHHPRDAASARGVSVTTEMLAKNGGHIDVHDPAVIREYYTRFFKMMDLKRDALLGGALGKDNSLDFRAVAEHYRIIKDDTISILVPYRGPGTDGVVNFEELRDEAILSGIGRQWIARARPLAVAVFRPKENADVMQFLQPVFLTDHGKPGDVQSSEWYILKNETMYDEHVGLVLVD